jgi:hypothetical protein
MGGSIYRNEHRTYVLEFKLKWGSGETYATETPVPVSVSIYEAKEELCYHVMNVEGCHFNHSFLPSRCRKTKLKEIGFYYVCWSQNT